MGQNDKKPRCNMLSTGPLAHLLAHSLALLTHSLAPHCLLRSRILVRSLICSLAHFAHCRARGKEIFYNEMNALITYRFNPLCPGRTFFFLFLSSQRDNLFLSQWTAHIYVTDWTDGLVGTDLHWKIGQIDNEYCMQNIACTCPSAISS